MNRNSSLQSDLTRSRRLISGVVILTLSNILVKCIGLFFKIPISYILSDIGMGYFNAAYTIYAWLYMVSTAGVPVAVSVMISGALASEDPVYAGQIRKTAGRLLLWIGASASILLILLSAPLSRIIGAPEARFAMIAVAPTLLFVSVQSVIRGRFQGHRNMSPTAFSQLIESAGKLFPGILLAYLAAKRGLGYPLIAAFGILGVSIGGFFAMLYLIAKEKRWNARYSYISGQKESSQKRVLGPLMRLIVPITLSSSVMSLTSLIDLGMIMRRLQIAGLESGEATALYGNYTTLVVPLFNVPSVLVYPIACALIPEISSYLTAGKCREASRTIGSALKLSSVISLPCAMGIGVFSYPILSLVFRDQSAAIAAPLLSLLAPAIFFLCMLAVTNSILQASGRSICPMISMLCGALVKLIVGYALIGNPPVAMKGAPISTLAFYVTASLLNLLFVIRTSKEAPSFDGLLLRPLFASICSVLSGMVIYRVLPESTAGLVRLVLAVFPTVIIYLFLVLYLRILSDRELEAIPFGGRIISMRKPKKRRYERKI